MAKHQNPDQTVVRVSDIHAGTSYLMADIIVYRTREEAEAVIAGLPKWVNVKVCSISGMDHGYQPDGSYDNGWRGWFLAFHADLVADGVNGGVNETGLKRLARLTASGIFRVVDERTAVAK